MPIRRSVVAAVATTLAFGLALVPVTADAAQVQNCLNVQVPTNDTAPWYKFNHTTNPKTSLPADIDAAATQLAAATGTLSPSSSSAAITRAEDSLEFVTQNLYLEGQLALYDAYAPAYELFAGLSATSATDADLTAANTLISTAIMPVNSSISAYGTALSNYEAAIDNQINDPMTGTVTMPSAGAVRATAVDLVNAINTFFTTGSNKVVLQTVNQCSILTVPDVAVTSVTSKFGQAASVSTSVNLSGAPQSGTLTVLIDGKAHSTPQITGSATLALPAGLSVGKHYVTVAYNSTQGAGPSVATGIVTVKKGITSTAVKLSKSSVKKGKSAKVTVTVATPGSTVVATGKATVYVNGKKFSTVSLKKGKVTVSLKTGKTGTLKVRAKYLGSASYVADASTTKNVKIK